MQDYDFGLYFKLANPKIDPEIYLDDLFEAGCDDSSVGVGKVGYLNMEIIRTANSATEAIRSLVNNVKSVIPDAELLYISPDVLNTNQLAKTLLCSRLNILDMKNNLSSFPTPINSDSCFFNWHLATILKWFRAEGTKIDQELLDVAEFAMQFNLAKRRQVIESDSFLVRAAQSLLV